MIFDGSKKIIYRPISFVNNRAVPNTNKSQTINIYLDEKSARDNKILSIIQTTEIIGSDNNMSVNDNIDFISFEYFLRNMKKFENRQLNIEIGLEQDVRTKFIRDLISSQKSPGLFIKTFKKKEKYHIPIRYLDDTYLDLILSPSANIKQRFMYNFPLYPYNTELIYNEALLYREALLQSGDISAYQINMKMIIGLACLLDTIQSLSQLFTKYTDTSRFVGESDVHTLINIYWDMQIFLYENIEYNELVSAGKMDYIDEWCLRNKMNVETIHKFVACYLNILTIFDSLFPVKTDVSNLIYFPQYIFPIGVQQALDKRNENADYHHGESKLFPVEGSYAANQFIKVYSANRISNLGESNKLLPKETRGYRAFAKTGEQEIAASKPIAYVYFSDIQVPIY